MSKMCFVFQLNLFFPSNNMKKTHSVASNKSGRGLSLRLAMDKLFLWVCVCVERAFGAGIHYWVKNRNERLPGNVCHESQEMRFFSRKEWKCALKYNSLIAFSRHPTPFAHTLRHGNKTRIEKRLHSLSTPWKSVFFSFSYLDEVHAKHLLLFFFVLIAQNSLQFNFAFY